jgi:hypothetical protein
VKDIHIQLLLKFRQTRWGYYLKYRHHRFRQGYLM